MRTAVTRPGGAGWNALGKCLLRGVSTVMDRLQTPSHKRVGVNGGFRQHGAHCTVRLGVLLPRRNPDYVVGVGPLQLGLCGCATLSCTRPKHMGFAPWLCREQMSRGVGEIFAVFLGPNSLDISSCGAKKRPDLSSKCGASWLEWG